MNRCWNTSWGILPLVFWASVSWAGTADEGESVKFSDGLSMNIPMGWKASVVETPAVPKNDAGSLQDPKPVKLLLYARPLDEVNASLSILRDESVGASAAVQVQSMFARLEEIAASQGCSTVMTSTRGHTAGREKVILGEILADAGGGKDHRIFAVLTVVRPPNILIRCYWQWDVSDGVTRDVFDQWLATSTFGDTILADLLNKEPGEDAEIVSVDPESPTDSETDSSENYQPVEASERAVALASDTQKSLIVVEGRNGRGSGFVCKFKDGKPYVVTNAHVLSSNPDPKFNSMSGEILKPGEAALGVESDIFRALASEGTPALEMMTDADGAVKIGDKIAVLGNSEGAGVVTILEGKIVGLGPNLVEVDAPFVSGNSGSPIIHLETGKVIGIATYLQVREVDKDNQSEVKTVVRRFGYRPDQVKIWEPVNWNRFYSQSEQVDRIKETSAEFIRLFAYSQEGKLTSGAFSNSGIRRAIEDLERAGRSGVRMSASDRSKNYRSFLSSLKVAAIRDIEGFDSRNAYDYFRREVEDEKRFRDDISDSFSRLIKSHY